MTETNDLIDKLSRDLKPVRRIAPFTRRALYFSLAAIALLALSITVAGGPRADAAQLMSQPGFIAEAVLMLAAGAMAALAAFYLDVPDTKVRRPAFLLVGAATLIWGVIAFGCCLGMMHDGMDSAMHAAHDSSHACLKDLLVLAVAPFAAAAFMIWRGAPVWLGWAGYAMALAVASFAALSLRLLCPSDDNAHLLLWHFLPVFLVAILGMFAGRASALLRK
jgi:hypothetical protein